MSIAPEDRDKLLKDYSHGMKNKMQMLVNIIAQPNILLLDEPLTSLDVVVAEEMKNLLRSLKDGRITIFSTHILDLALDLCDEIVLLSHGSWRWWRSPTWTTTLQGEDHRGAERGELCLKHCASHSP